MSTTDPAEQLLTFEVEITHTVTYRGTFEAPSIGDAGVMAGNLLRASDMTIPGLDVTGRTVSGLDVHRV